MQRVVPAPRLLLFDVRDGWAPLGRHLNAPGPKVRLLWRRRISRAQVAFPWLGRRIGVQDVLARLRLRVLLVVLLSLPVAVLLWALIAHVAGLDAE